MFLGRESVSTVGAVEVVPMTWFCRATAVGAMLNADVFPGVLHHAHW